jgi:hypothetical protein
MAVQATIPVQDNGAATFLSSLFQNSSQLFGTGKQTTTSSTGPYNAQQLDPEQMNLMIANILDKAKVAFGPNIANSLASGNRALTDTTLADLQSRSQGYAAAAGAQAQIDAIIKQNQIAAQVAIANRTQTQKTAASPMGNLVQMAGLAATGYSIYDKMTKGKKPAAATSSTGALDTNIGSSSTFGYGADAMDASFAGGGLVSGGSSVSIPGPASAVDALASNTADVFGFGADFMDAEFGGPGMSALAEEPLKKNLLDNIDPNTVADFGSGIAPLMTNIGSAADFGYGADAMDAVFGSGDLGGDAIGGGIPYLGAAMNLAQGDTDSAIGSAIGYYFGGPIGGAVGSQLGGVVDSVGDVAGEVLGGIGDFVGGIVGGGKVICTELFRQGLISSALYNAELQATRQFVPILTGIGYRFWAIPYVKLMKRSSLATNFIKPFAVAWANQVCYDHINQEDYTSTVFGKVIRKTIEPLCYQIGRFVMYRKFHREFA